MSEKYLHEMIDDIEVLIDEAKPARFSPGKIMIEKDVLMTVIEELRKQIPGEIERSHKIILNKDAGRRRLPLLRTGSYPDQQRPL